ncbi:MAG: MFS transporter [Burkholderiales bacterium]|nr:MAG: MFS transporter [Burkholderiales bacterium]
MASIRIADPMLPALAAEFGGEPADAASVITFFTIAYGVMQLVWGPLGDRLGKLRVVAWAALAAMVGSLACALAPSLAGLSAARLLTGACCAAIIPLAIAHVGDTVAYEIRQATLARLATGTLTGMIAGQVLGGLAADTVGWRAAFGVLAAVFLAAGLAALRLVARQADTPRAAAVPTRRAVATVLGDGWARLLLAAAFVEGALMFGALAFVPTWLHDRTGMTLSAAGGAVAALGLGGLLYATNAKRVIARLGERRLLALGGALIAVGYVGVALLARPPAGLATFAAAMGGCGLAGVGFYMLHNTLQTLATQLAPQARATAIGLFAVAIFIGQSVGVALAARLEPAIGHDWVMVAAGLLLAALGVALSRRRA